ncbi:MAG: ArnT family glycosyltransferase [Thermomicrobiales bacterium]
MAGTATVTRPARVAAARTRRERRSRQHEHWLARWRSPWCEALLLVALFVVAAIARWPYLLRLPHFTDEIGEIHWALQIAHGDAFPLTSQVSYMGPYQHYLLAAALKLFGPHVLLPRLLVLLIGALTVVLTYLVGKELAGREVGLLAGLLLATLPQHIVVNSHVAWQNSTTPVYTTLACWALLRALRAATTAPPRAATGWWALAGLAYGVAVGTHLGVVVLAPALLGVVVVALWRGRAWAVLRRPGPYLAALAALVAYSPLLIANLRNGLAGYYRMKGRDYAFVAHPTGATYQHNLVNLLLELARMISNPFRLPERYLHYLTSPYLPLMALLCLLGLVLLVRRGQYLPAFALVSTAAIMPYFNHAYGVEGDRYLVTGRYVAFLQPLLEIAIAAAALAIARWFLAVIPHRWQGLALRDAATVLPAALLIALVLYPIVPLRRYYTHEASLDPDNASFLATIAFIKANSGPRTPVLVDFNMSKINLRDGADGREIVDVLLTLANVPHTTSNDPAGDLTRLGTAVDPNDTEALPIIVMMRDQCWPLRDTVPLQRISGRYRLRELYWTLQSYYGVYRYAPSPQPAGCLPASGPTPGD